MPTRPVVVLDTNVVLDLWLFGEPAAAPLRAAVEAGALDVIVTAAMLHELADVLTRPFASGRPTSPAEVLPVLHALARMVPTPAAAGPPAPRCTDPDDQVFIDLAWHWPARWLVSRDRAVLRLGKRALARGLGIVTPARWAKLHAAPP